MSNKEISRRQFLRMVTKFSAVTGAVMLGENLGLGKVYAQDEEPIAAPEANEGEDPTPDPNETEVAPVVNQNEVFDAEGNYTGELWTGENAISPDDLSDFSVLNEGINVGPDFYPTPASNFMDEIILTEEGPILHQIFNGRFGGCFGKRIREDLKLNNGELSLKELAVADCVLLTEDENNVEIAVIFSIPINGIYAGPLNTTSQLETFDETISHLHKGDRIIINGISIDASNQDLIEQTKDAINNSPEDLANFLTSVTLSQSEPTALPINTQQVENGSVHYIGIPWTLSYSADQ